MTVRKISTVEIKPALVSYKEVKPEKVVTTNYETSAASANDSRWRRLVYGTHSYGNLVANSAGQGLPRISTREV